MALTKYLSVKIDDETLTHVKNLMQKTYRSKSGIVKYAIARLIADEAQK